MHDFDFLKLRQPKTHWFFKAKKLQYIVHRTFFWGVERKIFVLQIQFLIDE